MPAPLYNAIWGTTGGAPGTGAFTPNAAVSGGPYRAWSTVPVGWFGVVLFEDTGGAWERSYCYWDGTTLSRGANQLIDSSTGSILNLTASAKAAMVNDVGEIQSHLGTTPWRCTVGAANSNTAQNVGLASTVSAGTLTAVQISAGSMYSEQPGVQLTSATTANAAVGLATFPVIGIVSSTAGRCGCEMTGRLGVGQLPTGPRCWWGYGSANKSGNTGEPSADVTVKAAFCKDSTDTNIQLMTSDGTTNTKVDTGITLAATGVYEFSIWFEPGSLQCNALLVRLDTGEIWFKRTSTTTPPTGSQLWGNAYTYLNGTNTGTAAIVRIAHLFYRSGW